MIGLHKRAVIGITALGALGGVNASDANPIPSLSDNLRYAITPYLWAPGISGNIDYNNGQSAHTNISTDKVLNNLSIGAMGDAEVHYGRWGLLGNAIYAKLSNHGSKTSNLQASAFRTIAIRPYHLLVRCNISQLVPHDSGRHRRDRFLVRSSALPLIRRLRPSHSMPPTPCSWKTKRVVSNPASGLT